VVSVPVKEGQTVNANQTAPTIVQIADLSLMEIRIEIAEGDITKVRPGMPVEYSILSEPGEVFRTELASIDPALTTLSDGNETQSAGSSAAVYYYAKAVVPNGEGRLRIGMTTQNTITVDTAERALMVPSAAVFQRGGRPCVQLLLPDGRVEERDIRTGLSDNMNTQVLSGLDEGDEVVVTRMTQEEIDASVAGGARGPMRRR
jgi:macrolide-specific efflux system membrane fusion protein